MMEQKVNNQLKLQWELPLLHTHQKSLTCLPSLFLPCFFPFPGLPALPSPILPPHPNLTRSFPHLTWIQLCLFEMTDKNTYA